VDAVIYPCNIVKKLYEEAQSVSYTLKSAFSVFFENVCVPFKAKQK